MKKKPARKEVFGGRKGVRTRWVDGNPVNQTNAGPGAKKVRTKQRGGKNPQKKVNDRTSVLSVVPGTAEGGEKVYLQDGTSGIRKSVIGGQ